MASTDGSSIYSGGWKRPLRTSLIQDHRIAERRFAEIESTTVNQAELINCVHTVRSD
jgi:hypothetical protein